MDVETQHRRQQFGTFLPDTPRYVCPVPRKARGHSERHSATHGTEHFVLPFNVSFGHFRHTSLKKKRKKWHAPIRVRAEPPTFFLFFYTPQGLRTVQLQSQLQLQYCSIVL